MTVPPLITMSYVGIWSSPGRLPGILLAMDQQVTSHPGTVSTACPTMNQHRSADPGRAAAEVRAGAARRRRGADRRARRGADVAGQDRRVGRDEPWSADPPLRIEGRPRGAARPPVAGPRRGGDPARSGARTEPAENLSALELIRTTLSTYLELFEHPTAEERALIVMWGATFPSQASIDGMVEAEQRSYDGWADLICTRPGRRIDPARSRSGRRSPWCSSA